MVLYKASLLSRKFNQFVVCSAAVEEFSYVQITQKCISSVSIYVGQCFLLKMICLVSLFWPSRKGTSFGGSQSPPPAALPLVVVVQCPTTQHLGEELCCMYVFKTIACAFNSDFRCVFSTLDLHFSLCQIIVLLHMCLPCNIFSDQHRPASSKYAIYAT